jgi:HK97 family phage major capsid protein
MKIRRTDGTEEDVADDYELQEGEVKVEDKKDDESPNGEEKKVKEGLKSFIRSETTKSLEKELDKISDGLVKKFFDGVSEQRAKLLDSKANEGKKRDDQTLTKQWFLSLLHKDYAGMREVMKSYMGEEGQPEQGENLVPTPLLAEVYKFTEEYGISRRDMRYLPFDGAGNVRDIPALLTSVTAYWVGKGMPKPSTKPTFTLVHQTLEKLAAIVPMTEEILEDAAINIIALLGELFGTAISREEDRVFLNGSIALGDPYDGVIRALGVIPVPMAVSDIFGLTADDLNNMLYVVPSIIRATGKFYMHPTVFSIVQQLKAIDGHYIWQQPAGDKPATIWNRPYELSDVLPDNTVIGEGEPVLFYTDLSKTCVYGDKKGLRIKLLEEGIVSSTDESPTDLNLATQDMVAFRVSKRVGYVPVLPAGISVLVLGESPS